MAGKEKCRTLSLPVFRLLCFLQMACSLKGKGVQKEKLRRTQKVIGFKDS